MTKRQKLQIEQSEKRQRINELLNGDDLTDEQRGELDTLTKRMGNIEVELRAAIAIEGDEEAARRGAFGNGDGEAGERGRLIQSTRIADYLGAAAAGGEIRGRAAEVNAALDLPTTGPSGGVAVPWAMLAPEPEQRDESRAFTTTSAHDGPLTTRPIMQRLFGTGINDVLGVRTDVVPTGRSEWPLITGGVAPAQAVEGTAALAAVTATFQVETLKPKRLTGRYEYTHEMAASVPDLEQALRRDLADAVGDAMRKQIMSGDESTNAEQVNGFLSVITAPSDPSDEAEFADYGNLHSLAVDGIHASMETEVSSVIGVETYRHAASVYQPMAGSGESGSEVLKRRSRRCVASSYVPAAASNVQNGNLLHSDGPNGGAMRGDSIAAVWPTLEVVRDIYSNASAGVTLTWITLWDFRAAFRSTAYARVAFKLA